MVQVPSGPITRARAKKLQGLIEEAFNQGSRLQEMMFKMDLQEEPHIMNIIQVSEDLAPNLSLRQI